MIDSRQARRLAEVFALMGSRVRLRAVDALLIHDELRTEQLAEILGVTAQAVRTEMRKLAKERIVESRRVGRGTAYRIARTSLIPLLNRWIGVAGEVQRASREGERSRKEHEERVQRLYRLQPRQKRVLELLAEGNSAEQIAERLGITEATARTHIHGILAGIGARSQLHAVSIARQHGFVT